MAECGVALAPAPPPHHRGAAPTPQSPLPPPPRAPCLRRNYTTQLQARGVGRAAIEAYIRTQLAFSAGCCRDACRFSYMRCGCEAGVVTLARRLVGDDYVFNVLLQQAGLGCGAGPQPPGRSSCSTRGALGREG